MKKVIGTILFVVWVLLACLLVMEPTSDAPNLNMGEWVGIVYLLLLFGLPIVWGFLLKDQK